MKGLLAIEWLKIKRYRTFWVLACLFLLLMPLWNYGIADGILKPGGGKKGINFLNTEYSFPLVWSNLGFWGSWFILFISVLVIIMITNEYVFRTNRQNVIDGWSKLNFYHAKVMLVVALSFAATAYLFVLGLIFGTINSGSLSGVLSGIEQVGYFFLLSLDYLGFALFISIWIRRSGLAIGLLFLYALIIENLARGLINHFTNTDYGNFLFLQSSDELLPFPLIQMAKNMMGNANAIPTSVYAFVTAGWCIVYYFAGKAILMKRDW